jgi:hypothetical protein
VSESSSAAQFFCNAPGFDPPLGAAFGQLLRPVDFRAPTTELAAWSGHLRKVMREGGTPARTTDIEELFEGTCAALVERAGRAPPPDSWARAVALLTLMVLSDAAGLPVGEELAAAYGVSPTEDLARSVARLLDELHAEAQNVAAGPLVFHWLITTVLPYQDLVGMCGPEVRAYAHLVRPGPLPAVPEGARTDRVTAHLLAAVALASEQEPFHIPPLARVSWGERLRSFFGPRCDRWTAGGLARVAATGVALACLTLGAVWWVRGRSAAEAFRALYVRPYEWCSTR